jgi:5,10-methenyltetrahydrofolate synthetase
VFAKFEMRMKMRSLLTALTFGNPDELAARDARIAESLRNALADKPGLWLAFVATEDEPNVEVDVPGVKLAFPLVASDNLTMDFYVSDADEPTFVKSHLLLLEPDLTDPNWKMVPRSGLMDGSVRGALVPALGYSRKFQRLGRGAGFYDRYLAENRILKIGVVFAEQLVEELPTEPHDIAVDAVITDQEVLWKLAAV